MNLLGGVLCEEHYDYTISQMPSETCHFPYTFYTLKLFQCHRDKKYSYVCGHNCVRTENVLNCEFLNDIENVSF
jgi:hypothetical protein